MYVIATIKVMTEEKKKRSSYSTHERCDRILSFSKF